MKPNNAKNPGQPLRLTDTLIKGLGTPAKDGDGPRQWTYIETIERGLGLMLVVSYGGTRTLRVLTYRNGRPRSFRLGQWMEAVKEPKKKPAEPAEPNSITSEARDVEAEKDSAEARKRPAQPAKPDFITLTEARDKARDYWKDPRAFEGRAATGSFKEVAKDWLKRHVEANQLRSAVNIRQQLETYIYPRWAHERFVDIRRREVIELLDKIEGKHTRKQADAVLATTIRPLMNWWQARDENYTSPIVRGMRRTKPTKRDRILSDNEIRALWTEAEDAGTFGALVRTLLLTAQRRSKVARMRWADLDDDGIWTIPREPREKGVPPWIKLPKVALDIVNAQPRIAKNPFVFTGRGGTAFNHFSDGKDDLDARLSDVKDDWTLHDLRRTARSLLSRAGVLPHISERVLGHAIPGVEGIYDRHAYADEMADALQRLANLVARIVDSPANVVALPKRRRRRV